MTFRQRWWLIVGSLCGGVVINVALFACGAVGGAASDAGVTDGVAMADGPAPGADLPAGMIVAFGGLTPPAGWLLCDGHPVIRSDYAALYAAIGNAWGAGDGTNTFNLPDLRGRFLRGVDGGAARDPDAASRAAMASGGNTGDAVGSVQADAFRSHDHGGATGGVVPTGDTNAGRDYFGSGDNRVFQYTSAGTVSNLFHEHMHTIAAQGGGETRPINAGVNYIVKL